MNLLKTDEVFFFGLATTTAVKKNKKTKTKQRIMKNIMIRNNIRNQNKKKTTNYGITIYHDRYVLHPDIDSFGG